MHGCGNIGRKSGSMNTEERAEVAAEMMRTELNHPLMPAGAKKALLALAAAVESLAHEVEILKIKTRAEK